MSAVTIEQTNEQYHSDQSAISSSMVRDITYPNMPIDYWYKHERSDRVKNKPTEDMMLGTALHAKILEPENFEEQVVVRGDGVSGLTKEAKAEKALAMAQGKAYITDKGLLNVIGARDSIFRLKYGKLMAAGLGESEKSIYWDEEIEGNVVRLKCRLDRCFAPSSFFPNGLVIEIKKSESANPEKFEKHSWDFGYHIQEAFYQRGFEALYGTVPEFVFLVGELEAPYKATQIKLSDELVNEGWSLCKKGLSDILRCRDTGIWPGYCREDEIEEISIPAYERKKIQWKNKKL